MKSVFVDSSVLFTATNSPIGGSAKLFTLKNIRLVVSPYVLTETERNVRAKLQTYHLERFFKLVQRAEILKEMPDSDSIKKAKSVIEAKDAPILADFKINQYDFLVTLDRKDFLNQKVAKFLKPKVALTPKELIELLEKK